MRELLRKVLLLQPQWSADNTPEMKERGELVRHDIAEWLRTRLPVVTENAAEITDWKVEASDGAGLKSEIPWVRVHSKRLSPSATRGWYIVYLFAAEGEHVYLSLMQGTTEWVNGEFKPRPRLNLQQRAQWARDALVADLQPRPDLVHQIELAARKSNLGPAYEAGTVAAFEYPLNALPSEDVLAADLKFLVTVLGHLYGMADLSVDLPGIMSPEVVDALIAAERSAGRRRGGQGFRLSAAEKTAIERRAVAMATEHLEDNGYTVTDVGATESYDLSALRGEEHLFVEVKGTTTVWSSNSEIILTKNEVDLHLREHPNTMLVIVSEIVLDRSATPVSATGGKLRAIHPWQVLEPNLTPVSFRYLVGE